MTRATIAAFALAAGLASGAAAEPTGPLDANAVAFLRHVDAETLSTLGVQHRGRLAVLDTLAREQLDQMTGSETLAGLPPAVAYMEVWLNAGTYVNRPVLYVREKQMRSFVAEHLDRPAKSEFERTRRIRPATLLDAEAWFLLVRTGRATLGDRSVAEGSPDLRDALGRLVERKEFRVPVDRLSVRYSSFLGIEVLRAVPGGEHWPPVETVLGTAAETQPAGSVGRAWRDLHAAWLGRDAEATNRALAALAKRMAEATGADYPSAGVRKLEIAYNAFPRDLVALVAFAAALLPLILSAVSDARWPRWAGLALFAAATAVMGAGFVIRWAVSGRAWYLPPIMNQYEAVMGSVLLGGLIALGLELGRWRGFFGIAAALYAAMALLAGLMFPEQMDSGLRAQPGILASPVMAVHVAVIIVGHALVGMTFFLSLTYVGMLVVRGRRGAPASSPPDLRIGGALPALAVVDRCNLVLAQLACWTVIAGTILGAVWGDFAWGRWWGWDPKETWALITCLVFVALIHVRFVTGRRWRGLVTALICIVGCLAMLFNWIVVNYILPGMHSYA